MAGNGPEDGWGPDHFWTVLLGLVVVGLFLWGLTAGNNGTGGNGTSSCTGSCGWH
jgi:hypothetical protein